MLIQEWVIVGVMGFGDKVEYVLGDFFGGWFGNLDNFYVGLIWCGSNCGDGVGGLGYGEFFRWK